MKKYFILFLFAFTLTSCGGGDRLYYDPILKYEKAGFVCTKILPGYENTHSVSAWLSSNRVIVRYKPSGGTSGAYLYDTISKAAESLDYFWGLPISGYQHVSNKIFGIYYDYGTILKFYEMSLETKTAVTDIVDLSTGYTNFPGTNAGGYWPAFSPSKKIVRIYDTDSYILDFDMQFLAKVDYPPHSAGPGSIRFIVTYSNIIMTDGQGDFLLINLFDYSTNHISVPSLIGFAYSIESASPKEKYLVIRKPITYPDFRDYGLAIVDLVDKTCSDLYSMDGVNYQSSLLNEPGVTLTEPIQSPLVWDSQGFISSDLKKIAFKVTYVPGGYDSISGRSIDDLDGLWVIDISSLNLSE
ncbi:MAG: hypothetical protein A2Y33_06005 [Spirochaetes bacterium GWF1_51_8]|nr:MAG: hypothetical protein A2Y33_06005 [Spirochaetes bacterium GWF1_51_8]